MRQILKMFMKDHNLGKVQKWESKGKRVEGAEDRCLGPQASSISTFSPSNLLSEKPCGWGLAGRYKPSRGSGAPSPENYRLCCGYKGTFQYAGDHPPEV